MITVDCVAFVDNYVANEVVIWATQLGFADPSAMDIDSTVQEANIAYPSDAKQ